MSEEFRNINHMGTDPENTETKQEVSNIQENTETPKTQDTETHTEETHTEETEGKQEPGSVPTPENPCYAHAYKREQPNEENVAKEAQEAPQREAQREPYSAYRFTSPIPQEPEKREKHSKSKKHSKGGMGKKFGVTVAAAVVFGLVAGTTIQAVNYVGGKILPAETKEIENTKTIEETTTTAADVSTKSQGTGTVAEVAENVMPSVVSITGVSVQEIPDFFGFGTQQQEGQSSGSGIIVGQNDTELLIATNNHVVEGTNSITVGFTNQDGTAASASDLEDTSAQSSAGGDSQNSENSTELSSGTAVAAQIKGTDSDNDLAIVAVKLEDIPEDVLSKIKVAVIGDSDSLSVGEQVVAIGNALGYGQSVTSGYVSALNKQVTSESADSTFIQTDAAINPGNSGGALLNMQGELIGINSAKIASSEVEGMGFAIPISRAEPILDELMSKKTRSVVEDEDKEAYIGITCKNVTSDASQMYKMPVGVFVDSIVENGPADEAGICAGDIITKIDGTTVETYDNLVNQLQYYEAGEEVEFSVSRSDSGEYKEQKITVTLGAKKDAQISQNGQSSQNE